ncbi:MAG TPA: GGDEF domain-containing protein [Solirubrobacterales bacterium]|nr:GGDEF domain-containing protein [Solirubrobacterales bacterium]
MQRPELLAAARKEARRERLLDMEQRVRRYRAACFAILALALASAGPAIGWLWLAPLAAGFVGFVIADRFMQSSERPWLWVAAAWGALPLLLGGAVIASGGPTSPVLMWFALPAVTLGARFDPWGMVIGTVYLLLVFLISTVAVDPASASAHSQALVATVALVLSTVILSGALVESDRAHRRRSTLDPLTGLFNRNALEQRLAELDGAPCDGRKGGQSHALLLCDLDHFKRVNDELGHAAGDVVLQDVAYTMRAVLRAGDSIYRIGGEEILVVLPGASEVDAVAIAERLRQAVRKRRPVGVGVTISIGAAVTKPDTVNTDDLVARADAALYSAKANGRDAVFMAN